MRGSSYSSSSIARPDASSSKQLFWLESGVVGISHRMMKKVNRLSLATDSDVDEWLSILVRVLASSMS